MFRKIIIFAILFQNIVLSASEITETEKVNQLIHIWGMAKYLHPAASAGKIDMDVEFLKLTESLKNLDSDKKCHVLFEKWIEKLNKIDSHYQSNSEILQEPDIFQKNANYNWIENSGFQPRLSQQLKKIQHNANIGNHYAKVKTLAGTVDFSKDEKLKNFDPEIKNHRLLFLATFWNAMRYWNVNIYLTDTPWKTVLQQMIPEFSETQNFGRTKNHLFAKLDDSHSNYTSSWFFQNNHFRYFAPVTGKIINDSLVVSEILDSEKAKVNNLEIGDVIYKVNNLSISEIKEKFHKHTSTSNENYLETLIERFYVLAGDSKDGLHIEFKKTSGEIIETDVKRFEFLILNRISTKKPTKKKVKKAFMP